MHRYYLTATITWVMIVLLALASCTAQPAALAPDTAATVSGQVTYQAPSAATPAITPTSDRIANTPVSFTPDAFVESFDGSPPAPQPWHPANWDVTVHSRDLTTWDNLEPMQAMHGSDCAAPPASHEIHSYDDTVFQCRDHLMTAISADGYGVIYLTPNHMVDFTNGEAVISWDMSTLRRSGRDWVDLWITPYQENLELPLESWLPDLNGPPRNAIHIRMDLANGDTMFRTSIIHDFEEAEPPAQNLSTGYESFLKPDAKRRDTFELRLSRTHIRFGMPAYNFYWIDSSMPSLSWDQGVVQFGHHSYNPTKQDGCPINQLGAGGCVPTTWHWDNISISPAIPFTMVHANQRMLNNAVGTRVTFATAAPISAQLRFAAIGSKLEVSFDNGATWQVAIQQAQQKSVEEHFKSYWMPIPPGTLEAQFRGADWWGGSWMVRDISIWAPDPTRESSGAAQ